MDVKKGTGVSEKYTGAQVAEVGVQVIGDDEKSVQIRFIHVGEGLETLDRKDPRGFYVKTDQGSMVEAAAHIVSHDTIEVIVPKPTKPTEVHYFMEITDGYPYGEELESGVRIFSKPNLVNSHKVPTVSFKAKL